MKQRIGGDDSAGRDVAGAISEGARELVGHDGRRELLGHGLARVLRNGLEAWLSLRRAQSHTDEIAADAHLGSRHGGLAVHAELDLDCAIRSQQCVVRAHVS